MWFAHLYDNINSVRENSATALVNVLEAYGEEAKDRIVELIEQNIMKAKDQQSDT